MKSIVTLRGSPTDTTITWGKLRLKIFRGSLDLGKGLVNKTLFEVVSVDLYSSPTFALSLYLCCTIHTNCSNQTHQLTLDPTLPLTPVSASTCKSHLFQSTPSNHPKLKGPTPSCVSCGCFVNHSEVKKTLEYTKSK